MYNNKRKYIYVEQHQNTTTELRAHDLWKAHKNETRLNMFSGEPLQ